MNERGRRDFSEERYLRIVREKTGYYLAAPIQGGALAAGADPATLDAIGRMALLLGPLFQIIDDIIDLTDGKGREAVGSDLREGKRSFLVAHAAAQCADAERERLFAILDTPREQTTEADIAEAIALFERYGTVAAGRAYCQRLHEQSKAELSNLPPLLAAVLGPVFEMLAGRER
jgi:geranylgeranyl pyrophosphate synthase